MALDLYYYYYRSAGVGWAGVGEHYEININILSKLSEQSTRYCLDACIAQVSWSWYGNHSFGHSSLTTEWLSLEVAVVARTEKAAGQGRAAATCFQYNPAKKKKNLLANIKFFFFFLESLVIESETAITKAVQPSELGPETASRPTPSTPLGATMRESYISHIVRLASISPEVLGAARQCCRTLASSVAQLARFTSGFVHDFFTFYFYLGFLFFSSVFFGFQFFIISFTVLLVFYFSLLFLFVFFLYPFGVYRFFIFL